MRFVKPSPSLGLTLTLLLELSHRKSPRWRIPSAGVREEQPSPPPAPGWLSPAKIPLISPWEGAGFGLCVLRESLCLQGLSLPRALLLLGFGSSHQPGFGGTEFVVMGTVPS